MTMTFGNVTKLYEILLKADKSFIAYYFLENETLSANELSNYSKCICSLRNKCAHFDRLYDKNFTKMACFDSMIKRNLIKEKLDPNKIGYTLYGYLVILARIFKINKTVWTSFLNNLYELLVFYNTVSLIKNYGFSGSAWYKNINMDINLYNKIISIDNKTINLENIDIIKSKFY
jgi:abortive infection bacteriophage resistance protein